MTLRRKMGLQITAMIVGLLLIAIAWLGGIKTLEEDYGSALEGYEQLRQIHEVRSHLAAANTLLMESSHATKGPAIDHIQTAATKIGAATPWTGEAEKSYHAIQDGLNATLTELRVWQLAGALGTPPTGQMRSAFSEVVYATFRISDRVKSIESAARDKRRRTLLVVGSMSAVVILAAVLLGMWQYRSVLQPLYRLTGAVRRLSRGQFGVRIVEGGMPSGADNEFAGLAADFNRMADQLDGFYKDLEKKVAEKSKELIRSERLASVGYLAAGVAHEINNPLGIISGYAEYALADLKSGNPQAAAEIEGTLKIIRDEAFRCKDITAKLLSLARQGETKRQRVNLAEVAESVVSVLGGLRNFKDRRIVVRAENRELLTVDAVEGEIKQVLMNLLINALEATSDSEGNGEVQVTVTRGDDAQGRPGVTMAVSDNGRGMPPETLEHVFEPFFTDRPRHPDAPPRPGTGLGLSITHAIVQSHHGRISAHSEGPGRGSRFVVELPPAREG